MILNKDNKDSLNLVKFLLAIGIVASHGSFLYMSVNGVEQMGGGEFDFYRAFIRVLRDITSLSVPLFFLVSGYLLYVKVGNNELGIVFWADKYKSRLRGLLLPFLFANIITLLVMLALNRFYPAISDYNISDFRISTILEWFWSNPVMGVTWFIRELFVTIIISPILYILIKYSKYPLAIIALTMLIWGYSDYMGLGNQITPYGLNKMAIAFFMLGTFFSIKEIDIFKLSSKVIKFAFPLWLICMVFIQSTELLRIPLLLSAFVIIFWLSKKVVTNKRCETLQTWTTASFFVYLYHFYLVVFTSKAFFAIIRPSGSIGALVVYSLSILVSLTILFLFYFAIKKFFPKATSLLVGGR